MSGMKIWELPEVYTINDEACIAVDNGQSTRKISVGNYNSSANTTAKAYAEAAALSATNAATSVTQAAQRLDDINVVAGNVTATANTVSAMADTVSGSVIAANNAAASAASAASNASTYAQEALEAADGIENTVLLAESWAKGGTGIRVGEDTNNAAYYARQAGAAISGGVFSFNSRAGHVSPEYGDYNAQLISRGTSNVNADLTAVETGVTNAASAASAADTKATNAASAASAAQTTADNAASAASEADTKATNAASTATAAQSAASAADTKATNAASAASAAQTLANGLNNVVMKTLTVAGWSLNSGVYTQTVNFTKIHSLMPYVVPCGNAIGTLPTEEQESAFGSLQCIGDTTANTMTFYADAAPTVAINIVVQGVE